MTGGERPARCRCSFDDPTARRSSSGSGASCAGPRTRPRAPLDKPRHANPRRARSRRRRTPRRGNGNGYRDVALTPMGDFSLTTTIDQPPTAVFAFIGEPTNMSRWYDAIERVEITAGVATGAGTRFEIVRSLPGGRAINEVKITEYEPSRRITMESQEGPTPFRYRYTLEPSADGTRLRLDGRISSNRTPQVQSPATTPSHPSSSSEAWHETSRLSRRSSNPKQPSLDRADCRPMNPNTIVPFLAQGVIASEQPLRRGPSQRDWQRLGTPG